MATECVPSHSEAHQIDVLESHPYHAQRHKVGHDNTVFQSLFPREFSVAKEHLVRSPAAVALNNEMTPFRMPSLSVSARIEAWETTEALPIHQETLLRDSIAHFDTSGNELLPDGDREDASRTAEAQGDARGAGVDSADAQPPFHMRVREVEKRFREQMEVHRELTRATRQLQLTEKSVRALRAQRRTHALTHAIQERQEAVLKRVWPEGDIPPLPTEETAQWVPRSFTGGPNPTAASLPPHPMGKAPALVSVVPPSPASSASAMSPTSELLKDILNTFSKPRELRGDSSSAGRSVASPLTPAARPTHSRTRRRTHSEGPHSSSGRAGASTDGVEESFPHANRVTASGLEIVRPPPPPKPYPVLRYVEVPRKAASPITLNPSTRDVRATSQLRKAASTKHTNDAAAVPSTSSNEYSQNSFTARETAARGLSRTGDSAVEDGIASTHTTSVDSAADSYSSDLFEVDDEDGTTTRRHDRKAVASDISSSPQSVHSASSFTDSVVAGTSETSVVTSFGVSVDTDVEDVRRRGTQGLRRHHRQSSLVAPSTVQKNGATASAIVERFLAACDAAVAAAAPLLHTPGVRVGRQKQTAPAPSQPSSSSSSSGNSSQTSASSTRSRKAEKRSDSSATLAEVRTSQEVSNGAVSPSQGWREDLQTQLHHVRHLRRFRDHLIRHLEMIEMRGKAQREKARLLQETQTLAKARRAALRQPPGKHDVEMQRLLQKVKGAQPSKDTAAHNRQRRPRPTRSQLLHGAGEDDEVSEAIATDLSDEASTANSSVIEEDLTAEQSALDDAVTESIDEVVDDWDNSAGGSVIATESVQSIEEDIADLLERTRRTSGGISSITAVTGPSHAASDGQLGLLANAGAGLDEIEEELADRLAELSSTAISTSSSVPSEVEELVGLLPSSLIPSDVDEERKGRAAEAESEPSTLSTESAVATETDTSLGELHSQRRNIYVAVKRGTRVQDRQDNKAYMQDSMASSIFTASSDADVDTTVESSMTISERADDASPLAERPSSAIRNDAPPASQRGDAATISTTTTSDGDDDDDESRTDESDSTDALTALEVDMALTKHRRQAALRSATSVPSFDQLYNPFTPAGRQVTAAQMKEASASEKERLSGESEAGGDVSNEGNGEEQGSGMRAPSATRSDEASEADKDVTETSKALCSDHGAVHRAAAETQTETASNTKADAGTAATETAPAAYAAEDLVAQNAWKARQLHMLRQLRKLSVEDALDDEAKVEKNEVETQPRSLAYSSSPRKTSAEVALDAAEDAAREEWAQHWGVLESLLQTRFASPRYEERMTATRHAMQRQRRQIPRTLSGSSATSSANDASRSGCSSSSSASAIP
ncbi:hypothetical protein ABB37_04392 [Leptomonas pyrrhocoris]|uniref:Uncharacterized protein n=1 Tax=Leptomonas pyrrhocoris TaxID=157538 RepID=A0A0M9G2U3_LEPPY|nr:hypothetical protein ABB37_04392 [Leptomonas pyrrhocoris]KPA81019.1 hypothetical protein ABB37_04392 [Leptomonas pyrrhocoris]|eukprot:XP_015659458.1 hypothetical protein ABB37_04392 [Leptomonas pyrrhocoris]